MRTIFINENGRAACDRHGGAYLAAAVKANPAASEYDTPADNWVVVGPDARADFDVSCETCGA